jgi:hypothetical protein
MQSMMNTGKHGTRLIFMLELLLGLVWVMPPAVSAGKEFVIVEKGAGPAPVIVFSNAPPMTRQAADDLAGYIGKISGAKPEVITNAPNPLPERAIWVGYQPKLKELFPKVDFDFKHPEEILIACDGKNLVIAGRDRWDPDHLLVAKEAFESGRKDVDGFQYEYGTANAVFTFIRDYLGVRWLWPGEEDMPERATITVAPVEFRYHPALRMRHAMFFATSYYRIGLSPGKPDADWNRFNRISLDSLHVGGGHAFGDWWDKYHTNHPDYFALQPDGTRSGYPKPGYAKMCESNPALREQWLDDVKETVARHPTRRIFNAAENDGWNAGHCVCTNCRAWDHPDGAPRVFTWQGLSQEYVALSDRQVTFANNLARGLKARFPGKDYYVAILAYGLSRPPPVSAVPDDNVIIMDVNSFFHDWKNPGRDYDASGEEHRLSFIAWSKIAKNHVWRPNISITGMRQGMPFDLDRIAECFRLLGETGCMGVYFDTIWFYWGTQGPAYYLMAQLAWNPLADAKAVMDDYFQKGFGPAGKMVQEYFSLLQGVYKKMVLDRKDWVEAFDDETFKRSDRLLDRAQKALEGAPEKYARRLAFVRAGCEFLRLQTENRSLVSALRKAGDEANAGDLARARANWKAMQELARKHPGFWNPGYSGHLRPVADPDFKE